MKKKLAQIWNNYITSGIKSEFSPREYTRLIFFNVGSILGVLVACYFIFVDSQAGRSQVYVDIFVAFFLAANLLILRYTKSFQLTMKTTLPIVFVSLLTNLVTGGSEKTGIFWMSLFPVIAFFLEGKNSGLIWTLSFIVLAWVLIHLGQIGVFPSVYSYQTLSQGLISMSVVTLLMYFYESISERYFNIVIKQKQDLEVLNSRLEQEIDHRRKSEDTLAESIEQIEEQNKNLEDSKKAMLNVLEDERILEERLKEEKIGVEKKVEERTAQLKKEAEELAEANRIIQESIAEIEQERSRLDASINSLSLGFVMTDTNNMVVAINNAAQKILDVRKDLVSFDEVNFEVGKRDKLSNFINKARDTKLPQEVKDVNYKDKILRLFVSPIITLAKKEEYIGSVIVFENVTEAKIVERSKDEFLSIASHELRTPLAAIRSYASLLAKYYPEKIKEKKFSEMVNGIHQSTVRLIELVNDFLDTSKLEQGKVEFKKEQIDATEVVKQVLGDMQVLAGTNKIDLKLSNNIKAQVLCDSEKLKQVLVNLVGNGLKFTKSGAVTISLSKEPEFVRITVSDTGKGIAAKNQKLLFRKFQQAESSILTRDFNRATGLGLYISRLLVEGMGGKIWLENSVVGTGSVFAFTLPTGK